jgi:putative membrane protein
MAAEEGHMGFFIRVLINTLAIYFAAAIVPGIALSGVMAALGSGLVLGLVNAVVRPILIVMTLPFTLLTLGLFLFVLNGLCLWLTSLLVKGFEVHGFWAAVFGSILVSIVSWLLTTTVSDRGQIVVIRHWRGAGPGSMH